MEKTVVVLKAVQDKLEYVFHHEGRGGVSGEQDRKEFVEFYVAGYSVYYSFYVGVTLD